MHSEFYERYMRSDEWENKRQERMKIDNNRCVMCGRPSENTRYGLQVHHITYKRLGSENVLTDLVTLCGRCHKYLHNYLNRKQAYNDEE